VRELAFEELPAVAGASSLNLIRRCADGSLRMSVDRWQLSGVDQELVVFRAPGQQPEEPEQVLELSRDEVERVTWDRLPKQQARSQIRFHLRNGDLWTFSGSLSDPT
jgi:hypothetical protein